MTRPTLIKELPRKSKTDRHAMALYRCECGKEFVSRRHDVDYGITTSCGCRKRKNAVNFYERAARNASDPPTRQKLLAEFNYGATQPYLSRKYHISKKLWGMTLRIADAELAQRVAEEKAAASKNPPPAAVLPPPPVEERWDKDPEAAALAQWLEYRSTHPEVAN